MNMTPKQWADGIRLLAQRRENKMPGVAVQVLKRAILSGLDHKNDGHWSEPGEIAVISPGRYARGLEEKGIVTRHIEIPPFPTRIVEGE